MFWVDTHCHIHTEQFAFDGDAVLERAKEADVGLIVLSTETIGDSKEALKFASAHSQIFCAAGVHPQQASTWHEDSYAELKSLVLSDRKEQAKHNLPPNIVAIGEIGLDYYYENSPREIQKQVYWEQIKLAYELDLPFIIHERDAFLDSYTILQKAKSSGYLRSIPAVAHCFSGSLESAKLLLKMGLYLGFDGPLTFKNAKAAPSIVQGMPRDRLLLETDSPYLAPVPFRGKRNEPKNIPIIGEKVAELWQVNTAEVAEQTTANALRFFGFKARD